MRQHRANTASTRNVQADIVAAHAEVDWMFPAHETCTMQDVFCFAALVDANAGTMYSDLTSAFPVRSFKNMQYLCVVYVYDLNAIIVRAMPTRTDASMITAFTEVITTLRARGYHPALNVMDNECSAAVEKHIKASKISIQLIPPHNHRVNAAKRAIATFKERFIAAFVTIDKLCLLQLWDEFLPQVELTLNMLHFSRRNPNQSANQKIYGPFDFNKTPLALLGTKALIYNNPDSRASWAPHATDGYYIGPAVDHYRCLHFYIPATQRFRFADTWHLYPTHCQILVASQHDLSIAATEDLLASLGGSVPVSINDKIKYIRAIQQLTAIMAGQRVQPQLASSPSQKVTATPPPRVATTSNNTTAPNVIRQMPLVHQCHTCNNNPFHLLADDNNNDDTVLASNCSPRSPCPNLQPINLHAVLQARQPEIQLASQPTSVRPSNPSTTPPPRVLLPPKIISVTGNRVPFPALIPGNRVLFPAGRSDSDSQNGKQSFVSGNRVPLSDSDSQNGKQCSVSRNRVPFPAIIPTIAPRILHNHLHDL
jgi:hypothetical protein